MVNLGPTPTTIQCPSCNRQAITRIEQKATNKTHIIALLLCLLGCCPCACALYCTDCARAKEHYCSSCNAFVGVYDV